MVYFLANEIRVFIVMPFLTNQKIIGVIFWLVEIDQSGSRLTNQWGYFVSKCGDVIGSEWGILIGCEVRVWSFVFFRMWPAIRFVRPNSK